MVTSKWHWQPKRPSTTRVWSNGNLRRSTNRRARSTSNIFPSMSRLAYSNLVAGLTMVSRLVAVSLAGKRPMNVLGTIYNNYSLIRESIVDANFIKFMYFLSLWLYLCRFTLPKTDVLSTNFIWYIKFILKSLRRTTGFYINTRLRFDFARCMIVQHVKFHKNFLWLN